MNADIIRTMYDYHFALNRRVWDDCILHLSDDQFVQPLEYSIGSIRNHTVHMMSVDQRWFARLMQAALPDRMNDDDFPDRPAVRAAWDTVEAEMKAYLATLTEAQLAEKITFMTGRRGETINTRWEILIHVVNHGTDHRAQMLAMLYSLGAPTLEQDMMLYWWDDE